MVQAQQRKYGVGLQEEEAELMVWGLWVGVWGGVWAHLVQRGVLHQLEGCGVNLGTAEVHQLVQLLFFPLQDLGRCHRAG